ncbi:MAG: SDR family NAD(P)-dependent oxidoreductase [Gemmatimonadota bacterium]
MELHGKVALVTGAGVRVGRAIALALASRGAALAVHYHASADDAEGTAAEARAMGVVAQTVAADLATVRAIQDLIGAVDAAFGRLDVLVNSAAIFPRTPWEEIDEAVWDQTQTLNLKAPFFTAWHAVPLLRRHGGGTIINIADWAGLRPYRNYLPYVISKGGIVTLTKTLAKELAPDITVNAVAPGPVLLPEDFETEAAGRVARATLLKRLGTPEDVANAAVYLAESSYVTGHVLVVDGGRLIG